MINILVLTAHPDDEILWIGATLYELRKLPDINVHVICLWAILEPIGSMRAITIGYQDIDRKDQFYEVEKYMNYNKSHIVTETEYEVIQRNNQKDEIITETFLKSLAIIGLDINNISMILTHSYYGDERGHPHHIRLYDYFSKYTLDRDIGFGFFSILKIPEVVHCSILHSTYRKNQLHLLSYETVEYIKLVNNPNYYIEFQGNLTRKIEGLKLYKAINFKKHYNDYIGFSSISEKIYFNNRAKYVFENIIGKMDMIVKNIL